MQQLKQTLKNIAYFILRFHIPVVGPVRIFYRMLYALWFVVVEGFNLVLKILILEPTLRSICTRVGRGLWMERVPYITGIGEIVIGDFVQLSGKQNFAFSCKIVSNPRFEVGNHTFIAHNTSFSIARSVRIGDYCYIAGGVSISDNDGHPLNYLGRRSNQPPHPEDVREVVIGNDVWIGRHALILKGVKIGDRAVVGAQAVVVSDVPADSVVAGNPAKIVKELPKI